MNRHRNTLLLSTQRSDVLRNAPSSQPTAITALEPVRLSYHTVHVQFKCWISGLTPTRLIFHAVLLTKFTLYLTTTAQRNEKTKIRPHKAISELTALLYSTIKTVYHHFPKLSPDAAAVNVWETVTSIQMPINFPTLLPPSLLLPRNNEGIALLRVAIMLDFLKAADMHSRS